MSNPNAWRLSDLAPPKPDAPTVFSTFSCGGGSSMGYKLAGYRNVGANDIDAEMEWHYKANLKPANYYLCPIRDLLTATLPPELYNLDVLDGSPPCSTFSMAGNRESDWGKEKHFREGQSKQVLSDLFFDYLDLVEKLKPKVAVAENVKGMLIGNAKGYTKLVVARFREIGYKVQVFLINAADCGVPQRRERVFFCAVRNDINAPDLAIKPNKPWVTTLETCNDIQELTTAEWKDVAFTGDSDKKWWPLTKPGESYADAVKRSGLPKKLWNHVKLDSKRASPTLTATHQMFTHWTQPRRLTLREFIRLGSFPDDYTFKSADIGKYMIGMSVPPKMMAYVAEAIRTQWLVQ